MMNRDHDDREEDIAPRKPGTGRSRSRRTTRQQVTQRARAVMSVEFMNTVQK